MKAPSEPTQTRASARVVGNCALQARHFVYVPSLSHARGHWFKSSIVHQPKHGDTTHPASCLSSWCRNSATSPPSGLSVSGPLTVTRGLGSPHGGGLAQDADSGSSSSDHSGRESLAHGHRPAITRPRRHQQNSWSMTTPAPMMPTLIGWPHQSGRAVYKPTQSIERAQPLSVA